jgi:hypothetical protein
LLNWPHPNPSPPAGGKELEGEYLNLKNKKIREQKKKNIDFFSSAVRIIKNKI